MRKIWTDKGLGNEMKKGEIFEGVVEDLSQQNDLISLDAGYRYENRWTISIF